MKLRGGEIVVRALQAEGVRHAFGIPGTHNVELYDAMDQAEGIEPILVTDEQSASFMADGVSRTSGEVGLVNVVPGAGVTHCLSGVAQAYMDNVPLVVLACGVRTDTGHSYQVHDIDQLAILQPITKATLRAEAPEQVYPVVREAFAIARCGAPGPVAVEIPANYLNFVLDVPGLDYDSSPEATPEPDPEQLQQAADLLAAARHPALYVGNGARGAAESVRTLAEKLGAPVTTTIQGKGVFPESHPLWLWNGFGPTAPKFVNRVMDRCDCLLAIGCRFGEVATGSYGLTPPKNLIHVDIDDDVFNRNFPARLAVKADAAAFVAGLDPLVEPADDPGALHSAIAEGHDGVRRDWQRDSSDEGVTPAAFLGALQRLTRPDTVYSTDSGNGTFLAMEHLRLDTPGCFIGPIDFSCMGYAVPAAIGAKFANPDRDVVALAGDGALLMTGLELLTAAGHGVAPLVCVLRDGELAQISQWQRMALGRDSCSVLPDYSVEALAKAAGCGFLALQTDDDLDRVLAEALERTRGGTPMMVDVAIDYSRKTYFNRGIVLTNFLRLPWGERVRRVARVVGRRLSS